MRRGEDEKAALRALVEGDYLAVDGSGAEIGGSGAAKSLAGAVTETAQ
jgi:hypothetical protein